MAEIKTERLDGYRRLIDISRDLASTLDLDILAFTHCACCGRDKRRGSRFHFVV